jgi:ribosomal protein S18 acetylase RimI-like enzyme
MVELAVESDIPSWLALVNIVADDFPGLDIDDYTETLKKNIARKTALCVKSDNKIVGTLLFSPYQHCLSCMAVHPECRRHGIASDLISEMLRRMPEGDISVTTFREDDRKGAAPRALYQKFGFKPDKLLTEFNYPVQLFILHRQ